MGTYSLVFSVVAITLTVLSLYLQYFRIRGPEIALLNAGQEQRSVLRPYQGLPLLIQQAFPWYPEEQPGHAVVSLVFSNVGDRPAYVSFLALKASVTGDDDVDPFIAHYSHVPVPASSVVSQKSLFATCLSTKKTRNSRFDCNRNRRAGEI